MKDFIEKLTKSEKIISFILFIILVVNVILFVVSNQYQRIDTDYVHYFYPFVEFRSEFLRGKYENTKLVASYNLPEFLVYGILPLVLFFVWLKLFKTNNKSN